MVNFLNIGITFIVLRGFSDLFIKLMKFFTVFKSNLMLDIGWILVYPKSHVPLSYSIKSYLNYITFFKKNKM